jgi:hypothetical protein
MDAHGVTCNSKDVYYHKGFTYDRLANAARCTEIDADRPRLEGEIS